MNSSLNSSGKESFRLKNFVNQQVSSLHVRVVEPPIDDYGLLLILRLIYVILFLIDQLIYNPIFEIL